MYQVIILDDNKLTADALSRLPLWEEHDCTVAAVRYNGVSGLQAIRDIRPDIILTDIKMPGQDGLEMIRSVQEIVPEAAVIFMSAYDNFTYVQQALRLGAMDYLLKPFTQDELSAAVSKVVATLPPQLSEEEAPIEQLIAPIIQYVWEHLEEHVTAESTAQALYMSISRLDKLIKLYNGTGFRELRISLRMKRAKELLRSIHYRIEEVAQKVGYKNYASFYRAFVREFNMTPMEYRYSLSKDAPNEEADHEGS